MIMRLNFAAVVVLAIIPAVTQAQDETISLNIGDPAPALQIKEWIKGIPVERFQKDTVYVVEFWATWCRPCKAAMPHLSELANTYKDKLIVIGVDIMEPKNITLKRVKNFVDSMGRQMNYRVAAGDSNYMEKSWFEAAGEQGIPHSFVINSEGRLAWIGHPSKLQEILPSILNDSWDINEALAKRHLNRRLQALDMKVTDELLPYLGDERYKPGDFGKPDSVLAKINEIVQREPGLKYAPVVASYTFSALLQTDTHKANEYGRLVLVTPSYEDPACSSIADAVDEYSSRIDLPAEIYRLAAEAHQKDIEQIPYPQLVNMARRYHKMAECYYCAGDKVNAIKAGQKAIDALVEQKDYSAYQLNALKYSLQQYKN